MTTERFINVTPRPDTAWAAIETPDCRFAVMAGTDDLPVYAPSAPGVMPTNDVVSFGNTVTIVMRYELADPDDTGDPVMVFDGTHAGRITALAWITATMGAMT